jgi:hypothetical protein
MVPHPISGPNPYSLSEVAPLTNTFYLHLSHALLLTMKWRGAIPVAETAKWLRGRSIALIRQSVSCDICGTEKRQTNHWFVAHEHAGELRLSGWSSRNRSRAGSKHLCGQTCLHKLVDEFMARSLASRVQPPAVGHADATAPQPVNDTSLTADAAHIAEQSSARLLPAAKPLAARRAAPAPAPLPVPVQAQLQMEAAVTALADDPPGYSSRNWRAEAWERERERELRAAERRSEVPARRGSGA